MQKYSVKKLDISINMAPLIDIVFLLLLFFMVASTLDSDEIKTTIQVPHVDGQSVIWDKDTITLYLDKNGMIYSEKEHIPWEQLQDHLQDTQKNFSKDFDIYADKEVDFEYIARFLITGDKLGIDKINFILKQE